MTDHFIRIISIEINHFKNIEHGYIKFCSFDSAITKGSIDQTDIMAIYGENGSGKTAVADAFSVLQDILQGRPIPQNKYHLFDRNATTEMKFEFLLTIRDKVYRVIYSFSLHFVNAADNNDVDRLCLNNEKIELREGVNHEINVEQPNTKDECWYTDAHETKQKIKWMKVRKLSVSQEDGSFSLPLLKSKSQGVLIDLKVCLKLAKRLGTSCLFGDEWINKLKEIQYSYIDLAVLEKIKLFANRDLNIITSAQLGQINIGKLKVNETRSDDTLINLFDISVIKPELLQTAQNFKDRLNLVLETIIPGLTLDIERCGLGKTEDGDIGERIQFVSLRYGKIFPLKYEAEGVKHMIAILDALLAAHSQPNKCVIIDSLDSNIYEYLFGQLLQLMNSSAKGQFIFTSHNLRALEVLPKEKIIFTTTNAQNRFVSLTGSGTKNLRDFYIKTINIGGQSEVMNYDTDMITIKHAFRKVSRNYCN